MWNFLLKAWLVYLLAEVIAEDEDGHQRVNIQSLTRIPERPHDVAGGDFNQYGEMR